MSFPLPKRPTAISATGPTRRTAQRLLFVDDAAKKRTARANAVSWPWPKTRLRKASAPMLAWKDCQRAKLALRAEIGSVKGALGGESVMADIVQILDKDLRKRWLNLDQIAYLDVSGGSGTIFFSGGLKLTLYEDETTVLLDKVRAGEQKPG